MDGTASWLATVLDQEMIEVAKRVHIATRATPDRLLPRKTGREVANELGQRYLIRYLLPSQVGKLTGGSPDRQFVTPTPVAPGDTVSYLALPAPKQPRRFVLLLKPWEIDEILGPRWINLGRTIEYLLPDGFPGASVALGWELQLK